jgi:hypothetical protein
MHNFYYGKKKRKYLSYFCTFLKNAQIKQSHKSGHPDYECDYYDCANGGFVSSLSEPVQSRVARWFVFKPKIPIWVNFGGPRNEKGGYNLWPFGIYYFHLVHFMVIWVILWPFGIFWYIVSRKSGNPGPEAQHAGTKASKILRPKDWCPIYLSYIYIQMYLCICPFAFS